MTANIQDRPSWRMPLPWLVLLCLALGSCQAEEQNRIRMLEAEWADALENKDLERLDALLAAEYRLTFVDAWPGPADAEKPEVDRARWLENTRGMSFGLIEMHDLKVMPLGNNVAIARLRMVLNDWRMGDEKLPSTYDVTDVWVRRDGRWQVVNRISEPLAPLPGESDS